jgi:hypothetical protein
MSIQNIINGPNGIDLFCRSMTCENIGGNCINYCDNIGAGDGIFDTITGTPGDKTANFKSLVAGSNVTITPNVDNLTISANSPVTSVFGRVGDVLSAEGDYSIDQLSDVTITNPVNNDVLLYNSGTSEWINSTIPSNINDGTITGTTTWSSSKINSTFQIFANQWFSGSIAGLNIASARTNDFLVITANVYDLDIWMYNDFTNGYMSKHWVLIGAGDITGGIYWGLHETSRYTTASSANDIVLEFMTTGSTLTLRMRLIGNDNGPTQTPQYKIFNRATGTFATQISFSADNTPSTIFYDQGVNNVKLQRLEDVNITNLADKQKIRYDLGTTKWLNIDDTLNTLNNVNISGLNNMDYFVYDSATQKWVNYGNYNYVYLRLDVNTSVTAVGRTMYHGSSVVYTLQAGGFVGERISFSAINGGSSQIVVPNGIIVNGNTNFTINISPYSSIEIGWENTYWCVKNTCGVITSSLNIRYDLFQNIVSPSNGQFLQYNSTSMAWENATLERCHPTCEIFLGGSGASLTTTLTTVNVWYPFPHLSTLNNNPSATGIFALDGSNFGVVYTGTSNKFYHSAVSISASTNDAADNYQLAYFINGNPVTGSIFSIDYANNNVFHGTAYHKVLELNNGDVIQLRMRNITAGSKVITHNNLNIVFMACCSLV